MLIRMANLQTAALVLISVVALFFFPAPRGSFVSTHGPVTELCERCEMAMFRLSAVVATFRRTLKILLVFLGSALRPISASPPLTGTPDAAVLRI